MENIRLDQYLVQRGDFQSREKAQNAIKSGRVFVDDKLCTKPAFIVLNNKVMVEKSEEYVSRGAFKIKKAFETFGLSFKDKVVVDIGASTGGFTQFAIINGAKKVYAVDVGKGELAQCLRENEKVVNLEGVDFRNLSPQICKDANMIIGDISFISLRHIFPKIKELGIKEIVLLFKPQFECGKDIAHKFKGVVADEKLHQSLVKDFVLYLHGMGFEIADFTFSPIRGKNGNIEYLIYINGKEGQINFSKIISEAFLQTKKEAK